MKILLKIIAIGFLIFLLANLANIIIFNSSIPRKFKEANWEGKWTSGNFSLIGGKIIANLPDEIPINETFEVDALIYYNIWSIYKTGGTKAFKLIGTLGEDHSTGGDNEDDSRHRSPSTSSLNFKAKFIGNGDQKIEYTGLSNWEKTKIVGGYQSMNPRDIGNFKIKKTH